MFGLLAQQFHQQQFHRLGDEPHPVSLLLILAVALVVHLVVAYPLFRIADRTRVGPPIFAFIPILNVLLMIKVADVSILWVLALFVPLLNLVAVAVIWMGISKRCGKEPFLGLAIFVPVIGFFFPWYLAFAD